MTRAHTVYNICPAHTGFFAGLGRYRTGEIFCEGGPAYSVPCTGDGCSFKPGTDIFEPSICSDTFHTRPGSQFAWAVNSEATCSPSPTST